MSFSIESAVLQWEDGYRRLNDARSDPRSHRALGRAVVAVEDELRKRLGSTFSVNELAALYREDSDWGLELTMHALPGAKRAVGQLDGRGRRLLPVHEGGG